MLVLTRKASERILIGDDVVITILRIKGSQQVRVGIEAPRDVPVMRGEIKELEEPETEVASDGQG